MKMVRCSITGHTHRLRPAHTQLVLRQTQLHNVLKQRRRQRNRHAANISGNENRKWRGRRTAVISRWVDEHRHQSCSWWRRWLYICLLSRVFVLLLFTVSVCCLMPVFMSLLCCCIRYRLDISITVTTNITCLTTICPGLLGSAGTRKVKQMWILLKKRRWVAYASLHLAPDRHPCQHPPLSFFCRPDALLATKRTASKHWRQFMSCMQIFLQSLPAPFPRRMS